MESYPSLSNANISNNIIISSNRSVCKLNSNVIDSSIEVAAETTNHIYGSTTSDERKMPLSRSLTQPQGTFEYVVTNNDTLPAIAARFQTTPSELGRINKIVGRLIFPGQVLYVPKRNQSNSCSGAENLACPAKNDAPPNTPNDTASRTSSYGDPLDNPVPGHVQRIGSGGDLSKTPLSVAIRDHLQLHQSASLPVTASDVSSAVSSSSSPPSHLVQFSPAMPLTRQPHLQSIDPADKECLERFLKINVRHITDGLGVVSGVLLVTPNALMFDPNVSDPLVIEHGSELYGVTMAIDLVLKTALYSDIAHMRVKHAPEAVPSVPKPSVYYASDDDNDCILEDTLRTVYGKKSVTQFDTIQQTSQEDVVEIATEATLAEEAKTSESCDDQNLVTNEEEEEMHKSDEDKEESLSADVFKDAVDEQPSCDEENKPEESSKPKTEPEEKPPERLIPETSVDEPKDEPIDVEEMATEATESSANNSIDDVASSSQSNLSVHSNNRLSSHFQAKLALGERHSAPLYVRDKATTPPLVSAISAEEANEATVKRLSAHGESRREQMLKRLSNPVDTIGNLTKSGISSGINATKHSYHATRNGISTGIMATKSGLSTGMSVTKTGFNKVLNTPKNLLDFSTGLVQGALGSKSDQNISEHLQDSPGKGGKQMKMTKEPSLGYTNMVDTKINAFENFDKLIPRPARISKDSPLYLCIRMGKQTKESKRDRRISPVCSFANGKKKHEREYWFSVPKDKSKNLYLFFKKWAPEVYGDVDDLRGCEARGLEPLTTDDEMEDEEEEASNDATGTAAAAGAKDGDANKENDSQKMNASVKQHFWSRRSPMNFLRMVDSRLNDGMSTDWNISNSSEEHSLSFGEVSNEPIMPDLIGESKLLTPDMITHLLKHLPARAEGYAWTLTFSTNEHGFSLNSLYRQMRKFESPVLLIIEDFNKAIFGALLSSPLRVSDHFYGTGETFLFSFHPIFNCYPWTGENLFFIKGGTDNICIGAGEGTFGLWLDGDLYHGSSHPCKTYGNQTLSATEDFFIHTIECWAFV